MHIGPYTADSSEYKLYLDLDGVFVDFNKKFEKLWGLKRLSDIEDEEMWVRIHAMADAGDPVWGDMDIMKDGHKLWNFVKKLSPTFLTATGKKLYVEGSIEKRQWVKSHFGHRPVIIVLTGKDKAVYADSHSILVDDMAKNIKAWEAHGGIGILHKSANSTIKRLRELYD